MTAAASRLRRLAAPPPERPVERLERCELCGDSIDSAHRHVVDLHARSLLCACRGCAILFARPGAGGNHYRLVPERRLVLRDFRLDDMGWASLALPVDLAFFFSSSSAGRVVSVYPGALGAMESLLQLDAWSEIIAENPVLEELEPDVEALLVNRARGRREHLLVPIDDCYALAGIVRTHWKGLAGGAEVWRELDAFFDRLREQATSEEA
jgi:hypothetical protein